MLKRSMWGPRVFRDLDEAILKRFFGVGMVLLMGVCSCFVFFWAGVFFSGEFFLTCVLCLSFIPCGNDNFSSDFLFESLKSQSRFWL